MEGIFNPTGIFYSGFNPNELNARSFADSILRLFPNGTAPLFALTGRLPEVNVGNVQHGYFTKAMAFSSLEVTAAAAAGDGTLTVTATTGVVPGMLYQDPATREILRVTGVASATTVNVTRGFGRIAAGPVLANAILFSIGNAHTEASLRPVSRTIQTVFVPNYTQIVRNTWALSDTARASMSEAGFSNIAESRQDAMILHATDIESILFWGQPQAPFGDPPMHSTQGIIDAIYQYAPGNVATAGPTTNYDQLVGFMEPAFKTTSNLGNTNERIMFGDDQAIRVMHQIGRFVHEITMERASTTFGLRFTRFITYQGDIFLMRHPLFNGLTIPGGFAIALELPSMRVGYMSGRKQKMEEFGFPQQRNPNRNQDGGIDADGGSITSEFATEYRNPGSSVIINGLTQGVQ